MAVLKSSITKSRSGHYTVSIKSALGIYPDQLFKATKIGTLHTAQSVLDNAKHKLLEGKDFVLDWSVLHTFSLTNIGRHLKQVALIKEVTS